MFDKLKLKIKSFARGEEDNKGVDWKLYIRVWREFGLPYWKMLLAGILFTVLAASAEGYTIVIVKNIIDGALIEKNMANAYFFGLQIIAAFGAKGIASYSRDLIMSKMGLTANAGLQERLHAHMMYMNLSRFNKMGIGRNVALFNTNAGAVLQLVTGTLMGLVQQIATLLITFGLMIYYAPQMCVVLLFLVPAIILPMILIMRKKRRLSRESFGIAGTVNQQLNQSLQGIKTVQAFAKEDHETKKFKNILDNSIRNSYKNTQVSAMQSPFMELIISIGLAAALIVGGYFIANGSMTVGDMTAFLLALTAAYKPAKAITGTGNSVQHGLLAAEGIFKFLDSMPDIMDSADAVALTPGAMSIKFENVSFEYVPKEPVLKNVNIDIPAGKICALVGQSGGGKTTMFSLLERFYEPQIGAIKINDNDIKNYTLKSLRENIAEVSQDVFLFNDTIIENIKYGAQNATHDMVVAAARAANAHDFIMAFPNGYNSNVGERGSMLSGGQKQRIAIARAILKDAPILLMDEATSALDSESEKLIQSALVGLMRGRTTFVIAHRLSTILDADIICVVKDGRIIESGTDAQLCEMNGEYKKLRDIQFAQKKEI